MRGLDNQTETEVLVLNYPDMTIEGRLLGMRFAVSCRNLQV